LFEHILENIGKHIILNRDETDYFVSLLKSRSLSKKELILEEGEKCRYINFVNSGALRAFYRATDGKESTIMFAINDWWITDMYCFVYQKPAMLNIEAIAPGVVLQLQKEDLDRLFIEVPKFERFFRIIMQNAYIREQLRIIQNLSLPAEERYRKFLDTYPKLVKQISQKQIASYLGITPEFLSIIRGKRRKKKIS
jgi:CRP/FNR family transcriptional regulator, anaerobic regulatory protein